MIQKVALYPDAEQCSSILVIGQQPNSTYDLYLKPRFSEKALEKLITHDPFKQNFKTKNISPRGCLVVVNRYVTPEVFRWIKQNRAMFLGVIWLLDDDLAAMVYNSQIPILNRFRPATTLWYQKRLKSIVDHLIVSSKQLGKLYEDWPVAVMPPVLDLQHRCLPIDTTRLHYFAKMHAEEHAFLWPIITQLLAEDPRLTFTVIANGHWARKWREVKNVSVLPEIPYADYENFIEDMTCGGIFLVPLVQNKLNKSRSDAKLLEVARSGSVAIVADHVAYIEFTKWMKNDKRYIAAPTQNDWVEKVQAMARSEETATEQHNRLHAFLKERFDTRTMII